MCAYISLTLNPEMYNLTKFGSIENIAKSMTQHILKSVDKQHTLAGTYNIMGYKPDNLIGRIYKLKRIPHLGFLVQQIP